MTATFVQKDDSDAPPAPDRPVRTQRRLVQIRAEQEPLGTRSRASGVRLPRGSGRAVQSPYLRTPERMRPTRHLQEQSLHGRLPVLQRGANH